MLVRDEPRLEVLMVTRHAEARFGAGALVFPGGVLEAQDQDPAWADVALGWQTTPPDERPLRISGLREAFEETGVLAARRGDGVAVSPAALAEDRQALAGGQRTFLDVLREHGLQPDLAGMALFARWITPAHMPKRFDTWFYLARAPEDQNPASDGVETVHAEWIAPEEALHLAETGRRKLMFPTRLNLQLLARSSSVEEALAAARARPVVPVQPRLERRGGADVVLIPAEAGYGLAEAPASVLA